MEVDAAEVRVIESSLVRPSENTPTKSLWLSQLDRMATRGHTPLVWLYRPGPGAEEEGFFNDVGRLKAALAKALVAFYPMAGRVTIGGPVEEVDCGNQGALFVVAQSDLTFDELNMFQPSPKLRRLLVPRMDDDACCGIQVTFLRCGGVSIGLAVHHLVVDAVSTFHFFQMWAAISSNRWSSSSAAIELPCHDRTLLRARAPPIVHPDALSVFFPMMNLCEPSGVALGCEAFVISKHQLTALKQHAYTYASPSTTSSKPKVSTFSALSAHIWKCVSATRPMPPDATTRLTFAANIRRKLRPRLPDGYFGNALIRVAVTGEVCDIVSEELGSVVGRINRTISRIDDEVARSAIDYFELQAKRTADSRPAQGSFPTTELAVISWLGMPIYDADLGWGKPLVMMRAESERGGRVYLMDGDRDGDGSVRVIVCMEATVIREFCRMLYATLLPSSL